MPNQQRAGRRRSLTHSFLSLAAACLCVAVSACEGPVDYGPVTLVITSAPVSSEGPVSGGVRIRNFDSSARPLARFDSGGSSVDAHDGEIERFGDRYYLYGASYGCGFQVTVNRTPFCGIKAYSSPDLIHWTDEGYLFDPLQRVWQDRCHGGRYGCFRPHVAYSPRTGRYVLWLNTYEVEVGFRVFESDRPIGPFVERPPPELATNVGIGVGHTHGDHNLFVDVDGTGYVVYTDWIAGGDIVIEELTADLLSGTGRSHRLGIRATEAPSIFYRRGIYYMTFSDPNCGYCRTGTSYVSAAHPLGPWSPRIHLTLNSCGGQPTHVATLPSTSGDTLFLYQSDLWINFEFNQAPAAHFWAPLHFNPDGTIQAIDCAPFEELPLPVLGQEAEGSALRAALICDVTQAATRAGEAPQVRFIPTEDAVLRTLVLPVYKRGGITEPLMVELLRGDDVQTRAWVMASSVHWNATPVAITMDEPVVAGVSYGVRITTNDPTGCYGLAYFAREDGDGSGALRLGRGEGELWAANPGLALVARLELSESLN